MKKSLRWVVSFVVASIFLPFTVEAAMPRSATLATHAVGSLTNAIGTGIALVVSRHTPTTVRVQPFAGPPAWLPSMDKGETDMGILASADAITSYKGIVLYKRPFKNTRLVLVGGTSQFGYYVTKESPLETVADLRGKRIPTDFPGIPIVRLAGIAALATAGLTYNDIVKVPVSDLAAAAQAFLEGRVDAGWYSVGSPAIEEANARKGGVKFLSVISTPEAAKRMSDLYPGSYPSVLKAGSATGAVKHTTLLTIDFYLVASKELSEEAVYEVVKTLWAHNQELAAANPILKAWRRERMVSKNAVIPYHSGAIRFFKETGAWDKEMDSLQAKLLGQNPES
ncbi:MAG: TAXI family TRAP transporter solute-binding subunit [candidate division KSB1 bacterium]|nr:TAXI family TRAP transporter solute-binding subunit [candidate division KSB1 bacterium]